MSKLELSQELLSPSSSGRLFNFFSPLLRTIKEDNSYKLTRAALRAYPLWSARPEAPAAALKTEAFGLTFPTPLGIAAGFDKDGTFADTLLHWRAGFVEVGTATPSAQRGNPAPRIKLIEERETCINAMGFPNEGLARNLKRLAKNKKHGIIGLNIGANRDSENKIDDYRLCVEKINEAATKPDYITINVSSPNTEGLRQLEQLDNLQRLLDSLKTDIPLLLKLSPDLEDAAYGDIAQLALEKNLAGLIATNTTINHKDSFGGGLSGAPLRERANHIVGLLYKTLKNKLPIIGVGGISSGRDAYERIRAGARLIQLYTAFIWHGPDLLARINKELAFYLNQDGFVSISQAVGTEHQT